MYGTHDKYNVPWFKNKTIPKISLSHQTVARQIEETGKPIKRSFESKAANFQFCALVIDECTDSADMTQLAIFIRDIDNDDNITESHWKNVFIGAIKRHN